MEEADYCIQLLNRGIMRHREITAHHWDGKTKYKVKESAEDLQRRDKEWEAFLENEEQEDDDHEHVEGNQAEANEDNGEIAMEEANPDADVKDANPESID